MNRFQRKWPFSRDCLLGTNQISKEPYRLVSLLRNLWIFTKWTYFTDFTEKYQISCLIPIRFQRSLLWRKTVILPIKCCTVQCQMDRFSRDFLLDIKRVTFGEKYQFFQPNAIPFSVKWTDFKGFLATNFKREPSTVWCTYMKYCLFL